jgi:hypothetical protein
MINSTLQWLGTSCLITMYVVMSFFPNLYPLNIILGCLGGMFYFAWSYRVANRPQMLVNMAGILVCLAGLINLYFG